MDAQAQQISQLVDRLTKLHQENEQLAGELTKVQAEENTLAAQNDELRKEIATVQVTGKLPLTPAAPPPK